MSYWRLALVTQAFCSWLAAASLQAADAAGAPHDPAEVLAVRGEVVLTQREIDAAFSSIPEEARLAFIRDGARVDQLIAGLLDQKSLSAEAQQAAFDQDPLVAGRVRLAGQKELAEAWLEHVVATAPGADFETLAREHYLADPERYRREEVLDVSHILIGFDGRTPEEARVRARSLKEMLEQDASRFEELVTRYSDDPGKAENAGRYPDMRRGQMQATFERAAFALQQEGEISDPVRTRYGFHVIRLNGRSGGGVPEFEEVSEAAIAQERAAYLDNYRANYLQKLRQEPVQIPEGAVEIMARRHFGEDLGLAPGQPQ